MLDENLHNMACEWYEEEYKKTFELIAEITRGIDKDPAFIDALSDAAHFTDHSFQKVAATMKSKSDIISFVTTSAITYMIAKGKMFRINME